jgi:hypothetical protein
MPKVRVSLTTGFLILLVVVAASVALAATRNFRTHLAGRFELPIAIDTQAQGQAIFQLSKDGTELHYKLIVANIENVTQAHIHLIEQPNGTGRIVVWLYPDAPPLQLIPGRFDGVLGEGTITADDLINGLAGQPLSALLAVMENGSAYVNVHTSQNPPGEIRGNLP